MLGLSCIVLQCFGVEHGNARGARVKVDSIAAIFDFWIAVIIVEMEFARRAFQCLAHDLFRNVHHICFRVHLCPGGGEQVPRFIVINFDAGLQ